MDIQTAVKNYLSAFNIAPNLLGYRCLKVALPMAYEHPELLRDLVKQLYPAVAKEINTTPNNVERTIRYSIKKAMNSSSNSETEYYFKRYFKGVEKITNSLFLSTFVVHMEDF